MSAVNEETYEEAMRQLEEIASKMENGQLDVDEMSAQLKKAQQLIALCRKKLSNADEEINKILEKQQK